MTAPRRRPIELDPNWDHDLRRFEKALARAAPTVLLGISNLRAELADAGWPGRVPDDDRRSRGRPESAPSPTVWQCCTCSNQFGDWDAFQDHSDRSGHTEATEETAGHDTAGHAHRDPAGESGIRLVVATGDLETAEQHWQAIITSWRALQLIAARHAPDGDKHTEPACWRSQCDRTVESRVLADGSISYRGMLCIDGVWVARPGERPMCAAHRRRGVDEGEAA